MRVAALAFGVLAGLVASLILALGGLDVSVDIANAGERQAQAARFGLLVVGNLAIFGAALALASPLAGAIFLVLGALAWVGAALLTHHTTDFVLITPPALLLVAAIFAGIAHFRRPRAERDEPEIEIIAPTRERAQRPSDMMGPDEEMGIPAFAAEAPDGPSRAFNDERLSPRDDDWNPRRRPPPPPRTKPAFRPIEEEYEDDEPSGFSRFALSLSSILSFGLYAALAGAAVLVIWNMRNEAADAPATAVAEISTVPSISSASSEAPIAVAETPTLAPQLSRAPLLSSSEPPVGEQTPATAPVGSVPDASPSPPPADPTFGRVELPSAVRVPVLPADFDDDGAEPSTSLPPAPTAVSEPSGDASVEPAALETPSEPEPLLQPTVAAPGNPMPRPMPASIAAQRRLPSPGITTVARHAPVTNNTGL